ncbi:MAG: mismatch repair protein MutS [Candidatus Woesearchaeota archaeon]|nr:mismatch repair protein MutS [Candidatus Woesearchaeota archaeon]
MEKEIKDGLLKEELTPAMKQFVEVKKQYPDCIIFFRMGDFYETFYEDAKTASRVLDITLTSRGKGEKKAPLAGIPYHSLNIYLKKLLSKGYKVVIVEQVENPKNAKGRLVKREVIRVITPGTIIEDDVLEKKDNNYIISLFEKENNFGLAICDISTGEFLTTKLSSTEELLSMLKRYDVKECIMPESLAINDELIQRLRMDKIFISYIENYKFSYEANIEKIKNYLNVETLKGYDIEEELIARSAGALLTYIEDTQRGKLANITQIKRLYSSEYVSLDETTIRNLEIVESLYDHSKDYTLISVIDKTSTAMGSRLLKKIILNPLRSIEKINQRLDAIEELIRNKLSCDELESMLKECTDIERIASRITYNSATPRDLDALRKTLEIIPAIKEKIASFKTSLFKEIHEMPDLDEFREYLSRAISENPPMRLGEGNIIKKGFNKELDELRETKLNSKKFIRELEEREQKRTGINNLRISYNKVLGYYIQLGKSNKDKVPEDYIIKQTLVSGNRYITAELKNLEDRIFSAEERINELEGEILNELFEEAKKKTNEIQRIGNALSLIDFLVSSALVSIENDYTRPEIRDEKSNIEIEEGRHPVVERYIEEFIPNSIKIKQGELIILTGPNMAGKSTFMRQIALITLMAHAGLFVPAKKAIISNVDKIFTRVGAYDVLSKGQSTFMVEMAEAANIVNNATSNSLILIDELGRGTSTFDGVSLAWSIAEYIYKKIKAKTIFATHYHVLNKLGEEYSNISNYNILVKETEEGILFLRRVVKGGTDKSYGIHVAKLAGLPNEIIERAKEMQKKFTEEDVMLRAAKGIKEEKQSLLSEWSILN